MPNEQFHKRSQMFGCYLYSLIIFLMFIVDKRNHKFLAQVTVLDAILNERSGETSNYSSPKTSDIYKQLLHCGISPPQVHLDFYN